MYFVSGNMGIRLSKNYSQCKLIPCASKPKIHQFNHSVGTTVYQNNQLLPLDTNDFGFPYGATMPGGNVSPMDLISQLTHSVEQDLICIKTDALIAGDRKKSALAISELELFRMLKNPEVMGNIVRECVKNRTRGTATVFFAEGKRQARYFTDFIQDSSKWRSIKPLATHEPLKSFVNARIKLAERMKVIIPKEAIAWAEATIREDDDLAYVCDEIIVTQNHQKLTQFVAQNTKTFIGLLAKEVEKLDDMETWVADDVAKALSQNQQVQTQVLMALQYALVMIYEMSSIWLWINFDQNRPQIKFSDDEALRKESLETQDHYEKNFKYAGEAVSKSAVWEEFADVAAMLARMNAEQRLAFMNAGGVANQVIWDGAKAAEDARIAKDQELKEAHRNKKRASKEIEQLRTQLKAHGDQVIKMRDARSKGGAAVALPASSSNQTLLALQKTNAQLAKELEVKNAELKRVGELLRTVLSSNDQEAEVVETSLSLTYEQLKEKRGIVVGGHDNLTYKLRKKLPNCIFYSADVKSVDEEAVKNSSYILFITGYVNHALTGCALKLSRLYDIPAGYTDRTNVNLVLEDMQDAFK